MPLLLTSQVLGEVLACTALVASFAVSPLTNLLLRWRARRSPAPRPPVLLVHGYGMSRGSMLVLGLRLVRAGYQPIVVGYHWLRSPVRAAERIARRAGEVAAAAGVPTVDVVAHSLGGLVSRAARALPGAGVAGAAASAATTATAIGRIITLGTPHRGEWWGHMPIGPMAKAMRPGAYAAANPGDLAITSYGDLVIRWRRATLDPPAQTLVVTGAGHGGLLFDVRAARGVIRHLYQCPATPATTAPAPASLAAA